MSLRMVFVAALLVLSSLEIALVFLDNSTVPKDSQAVDVTLVDDQGYRHFVVFEAEKARFEAWSEFTLELWVDDWVTVEPSAVNGLEIASPGFYLFLPLARFETRPNTVNSKDSLILFFQSNGRQFTKLSQQVPTRLRLSVKSGDIALKPAQPDRWIQAIRTIE